ncbi:MAG: hypothetical protein ACKVS6_01235 [Planctomycetota bacterium]
MSVADRRTINNRRRWTVGVVAALVLAGAAFLIFFSPSQQDGSANESSTDGKNHLLEPEYSTTHPARDKVEGKSSAKAATNRSTASKPAKSPPEGKGQVLILAYFEIDAKPIPNLVVAVVPAPNSGKDFGRYGKTNEHGQAVLRDVPKGKWVVMSRGQGHKKGEETVGRAFGEVEVLEGSETTHYIVISSKSFILKGAAAIDPNDREYDMDLFMEIRNKDKLVALGTIALPEERESGIGGFDIPNPIMLPRGYYEIPYLEPGDYTITYHIEDTAGRVIGRKIVETFKLENDMTLASRVIKSIEFGVVFSKLPEPNR